MPLRLTLEIDLRRRCRASGYIKDLVSKLHSLERAGRIRIERIEKNYIGPQPDQPGYGDRPEKGLSEPKGSLGLICSLSTRMAWRAAVALRIRFVRPASLM